MRRKIIAGNWKMNKTPEETKKFIEELKNLVKDTQNEVIICVPYVDLAVAIEMTEGTNINVGAQNMHFKQNGAYTGEISPNMLTSIGTEYVILGHSERRQYYNETDATVNMKLKVAFENNLKPIVCVGESLEQREEGITNDVISSQIRLALEGLSNDLVEKTIIAYEPIWAIGTGKTASSQDANDAIKTIRNKIEKIYGRETAEKVIIQYGGSVKSSNAKELFEMSDIDGGLVGGASLDPVEFSKIVNYDK